MRKMTKWLLAAGVSSLLMGSICCAEEATRTVVDLADRQVELPENVESIISIPWPWASIVFAVDGTEEHIAGMAETAKKAYNNSMFKVLAPSLGEADSEYIDDAAAGGTFGQVNFEEMAKIDPDMVLVYKAQSADFPNYETIGVPAVVINYGTMEQVEKGITLLGEILHKEDRAQALVDYQVTTEEKIAAMAADIKEEEKPTVLYLYNSTLMTQPVGFTADMITEAGGMNAAANVQIPEDSTNNFATLDMEEIYAMDPDIILMSNFDPFTPEDIYGNTLADADWSKLKAVQNKQVYKIPMGLYRWSQPNVEAHLYLEWLGKVMHPAVFESVDIKADILNFYKDMFSYDLNEEELAQIFRSKANAGVKLW